eukprot:SM000060S19637  [mRNA]  locus=s60:185956:191116:- [translate_table: standard]
MAAAAATATAAASAMQAYVDVVPSVDLAAVQPLRSSGGSRHPRWIVVGCRTPLRDGVRKLAALPGWKLVLVWLSVDAPPVAADIPAGAVLLDAAAQEALGFRTAEMLPRHAFARTNVGYLYAIQHGADLVYEASEQGELLVSDLQEAFHLNISAAPDRPLLLYEPPIAGGASTVGGSVVNPYIHFGQPSMWPLGYPLDAIARNLPEKSFRGGEAVKPVVQHGLTIGAPTVDALLHLTRVSEIEGRRELRVDFDRTAPPVVLPGGLMSPFTADNTLYHTDALWAILLPCTLPQPVAIAWRSYWAQRLLQETGGQLAFFPPSSVKREGAMGDFDAQAAFEASAGALFDARRLVDFLHGWEAHGATLADRLLELTNAMVVERFLGPADSHLTAAWLQDLAAVGYQLPLIAASPSPPVASRRLLQTDTSGKTHHCLSTMLYSPLCSMTDGFVLEVATDYPGNDLKYMESVTIESCESACLEDCRCVGFLMTTDWKKCFTKSRLEPFVARDFCLTWRRSQDVSTRAVDAAKAAQLDMSPPSPASDSVVEEEEEEVLAPPPPDGPLAPGVVVFAARSMQPPNLATVGLCDALQQARQWLTRPKREPGPEAVAHFRRVRMAFADTVLVITYTTPAWKKSIRFLRALYGRVFGEVVFVVAGELDPVATKYGAQMVDHPTANHTLYRALPDIMAARPLAGGFLVLHSEAVLNYWALLACNRSRIWMTHPDDPDRKLSDLMAKAATAAGWQLAPQRDEAVLQDGQLPPWNMDDFQAAIPKHFLAELLNNLQLASASRVLGRTKADVFHIPGRHAAALAQLIRAVAPLNIEQEVVIPNLLLCLDPFDSWDRDAFQVGQARYLSKDEAAMPAISYSPLDHFVYPWRLGEPEDVKNAAMQGLLEAMAKGDPTV